MVGSELLDARKRSSSEEEPLLELSLREILSCVCVVWVCGVVCVCVVWVCGVCVVWVRQ